MTLVHIIRRMEMGRTQETQFNKYQKLGGGWIAPEVSFMVDRKVVTTEKYSEIRGDVTIDPKLFDPPVLDHRALEGVTTLVGAATEGRPIKLQITL